MRTLMRRNLRSIGFVLAGTFSSLLCPSTAFSQSGTWLNTGTTSALWSETTNWVGGVVPGVTSGTTVTGTAWLAATSSGTYGTTANPILIDAGRTLNVLRTDTNAGAYTIGTTAGNALTLGAGGSIYVGASNTNNPLTINAPLRLLGNMTVTQAASSRIELNGAIAGTGTAGTLSTLTLGGFTGATNNFVTAAITNGTSGGVVRLQTSGAVGWTLSGTSTLGGGLRIGTDAGYTVFNTGSISAGSTGNSNSINSGTFNNSGIVNTTNQDTSVNGNATLVNSGTFSQSSYSNLILSGNAAVGNSGRINYGGFFAGQGSGTTYELSTFTNNVGGNFSSGDTSFAGAKFSSFTNAGGAYTVGNALSIGRSNGSTATGTTSFTVTSGTVTAGSSGAITLSISGTVSNATTQLNLNGGVFQSGTTIRSTFGTGTNNANIVNFGGGMLRGTRTNQTLLGTDMTAVNLDAGGGTIDLGSGITNTIAASMAGVGGLMKTGSGTLILTGSNNAYGGNTTISTGTLQIGDGSTLAGSLPGNVVLSNTSTLAFNSTVSQTYAGLISGTGSVTKVGVGGVLTLSGNGSAIRNGITLSSGGLLNTGSLSTGSAANAGNVAVNSGTYTNQGRHSFDGSLSVASGASVVNSGTMTMGAGSFFQINGTGAGQNTGTMNLNFFRLNGGADAVPTTFANDANGAMTIDSFIIGDGGFGAFTNNGGRLTVTNNFGQFSVGRATGSTTGTSTFTVASGTVTVNADGSNSTFRLGAWSSASNTAGVINLNGGLFETVAGIAKATSSGTNNSAFVNFAGGTLRGLTNGATLLNSNLTGVAINAGGGTIDLGAGITNTIAAAMSGAGGLTKTGSGVLQLTGGNTYAGLTNVDAGTLRVNGLLGVGGVSVASGALLAGSGTIGGPVNVLAGGIVGPGNSPGTLTVNDAFSLAGTSILDFELNAGDTTPGGGINDLITGVTNLTLGGFLDITGSGDWTTLANGSSWRLFNYSGTLTDNGLTIRTAPTLAAGQSLQISTATPNQVNVIVVPEPGAIALAGLGIALAGWVICRQRRS
jgi:fibronectin-binding autotransporter adhesin